MKLLAVAKAALYGIFLNYYCYYVINGAFIPGGTVFFLAISIACVGIDVIQRRAIYIGNEIKCWILYVILSFFATAFVTGSLDFLGDLIKHAQRLMIIMMVAYICEREGSIRFGLRLMAVTAVALALSVLSVTGDYQLKLDILSGANLSENDTGAIMAFGCFAVLFAWGSRERTALGLTALKALGIVCCLAVMFLSGSRKSLIAAAIIAAGLLLLCAKDYFVKLKPAKVLTALIIIVAAYLIVSETLLPYATQTSLYRRMFGLEADVTVESDAGRLGLYRLGLQEFLARPLLGMGFNQFAARYRVYTHSTYAEPLACSGVIGLLYLYPYYSIIKKQIWLIQRSRPGTRGRLKQKEILVYLCVALFIGAGIPFMYKDAPCILLGTFIAHQTISFRQLRATGEISSEY